MKNAVLLAVLGLLVIGGVYWFGLSKGTVVGEESYSCADNKSIEAVFYEGKKVEVAPGERPVPTGSVTLVLSDKRRLTLPQTLSASGVRYANKDESFIFWTKGETAFVVEGDTETYSECVEQE